MSRINWDGGRVRRLSPSAIQLLMQLCAPNSLIRYTQSTGNFHLCVGAVVRLAVQPRTVDALALPRLIARCKDTAVPCYMVTERARDIVREYVRARCEAQGHDPYACTRPECMVASD